MKSTRKTDRRLFASRLVAILGGVFSICGLFVATDAAAETSSWAKTDGGRMRIIALPPDENGHVRAGLEIAPDVGWHTYWSVPGSGGIPPQISLSGGGNLSLTSIAFPAPQIHEYDGMRDFVYYDPIILPLTLQQAVTGEDARLDADVFIGVCADICVPFQAHFDMTLPPGAPVNLLERARLDAAEAGLPQAPSEDFSISSYQLTDNDRAVIVDVTLPQKSDATSAVVIGGGPDGQAFAKAETLDAAPGRLQVKLRPTFLAKTATLRDASVMLLVKAGHRAMQTELELR